MSRWLCFVVALAGCPRPSEPLKPALSLADSVDLVRPLTLGEVLVYDVIVDRDGAATQSEWTYVVDSTTDASSAIAVWNDAQLYTNLNVWNDGRLTTTEAATFATDVLQHTVWIRLPTRPVTRGDTWDDPQLIRPFLNLLPVGTVDRVRSESTLAALTVRDEVITATIDSEAEVRLHGRVVMTVTARATFDVSRGRLVDRALAARFFDPAGTDTLRISAHESSGLDGQPGGHR